MGILQSRVNELTASLSRKEQHIQELRVRKRKPLALEAMGRLVERSALKLVPCGNRLAWTR